MTAILAVTACSKDEKVQLSDITGIYDGTVNISSTVPSVLPEPVSAAASIELKAKGDKIEFSISKDLFPGLEFDFPTINLTCNVSLKNGKYELSSSTDISIPNELGVPVSIPFNLSGSIDKSGKANFTGTAVVISVSFTGNKK